MYRYFFFVTRELDTPARSMLGLPRSGKPLNWIETKSVAKTARYLGAEQFLKLYTKHANRSGDPALWGDELGFMIVRMDKEKRAAQVSLRAHEVLAALNEDEESEGDPAHGMWHSEYASYMVGSTPARPYGPSVNALVKVTNDS